MIATYVRLFSVANHFDVWKDKSSLSIWFLIILTLIILFHFKWCHVGDMDETAWGKQEPDKEDRLNLVLSQLCSCIHENGPTKSALIPFEVSTCKQRVAF